MAVLALGLIGYAAWLGSSPVRPSDASRGTAEPGDAAPATPEPTTSGPPNVVIFLIDTLRADRVGTYGYDKPTTPRMDALAAESVVFEQCNAPAPWTLPSVVSLLTSTFACEHGVLVDGQRIAPQLEPLAARLGQAGYFSASFFSNAYAGKMSGLDRGFDSSKNVRFVNGQLVETWLDAAPTDRPFHLYLHNIEPHNPYNAPDRLVQQFGAVSPETKELVKECFLGYRKLTRVDFAARRPVGTTDNTAEQAEAIRRLDSLKREIDVLYDAVTRHADERLGSVIDVLKRRGRWDNTLFIVTSDHGEELGDHGGWQHDHTVCEEMIHVPLIVHFPGRRFAGRRVDDVVSLVDVMPTILEAIGRSDLLEGCRGVNLLPMIESGDLPEAANLRPTAIRINRKKYYRPYKETRGDVNLVIRQGHYKGIWNAEPQTLELYDLSTDPREMSDLSQRDPERAGLMERFARAWLDLCGSGASDPTTSHPDDLDEQTRENLRSLGYLE
jgi:arylsulfatase A-like enzyme